MESEVAITFCQSDLPCTSFAALEDMRKKGELCDFTLKVGNCSFAAHRVVLAAGIPYFRTLFTCEAKPEETEISVGSLDPAALQSLIEFAYSSRIIISTENVQSVLQASQFLQLPQVFEAGVKFLSQRLGVGNVLKIRALGQDFNNTALIQKSMDFISKNFEEFSNSDDFSSLSCECLKEIISRDELEVSNEGVVFEAVINWVKYSPFQRHTMLPELLTEVRLVLLPTDYLIDRVSSEKLIRSSTPCRDHLDKVKDCLLRVNRPASSDLKTQPRKLNAPQSAIQAECGPRKLNAPQSTIQAECGPRKLNTATSAMYAVCRRPSRELSIYYHDFVEERWCKMASKKKFGDVVSVTVVKEVIYIFLQKAIQAFHVRTLEWKQVSQRMQNFRGACVSSYGSKIYFFGASAAAFMNTVHCFNTEEEKWGQVGNMTTDRCHASSALVGEYIFLTGGGHDTLSTTNSVEKYNPLTGEWSTAASMLFARRYHGCASLNEKIYVCGGENGTHPLRTAEMYDSSTNQWHYIHSAIPKGFIYFVPHMGKLYALGGGISEDWRNAPETATYDPKSGEWKPWLDVPKGFVSAVSISANGN